MPSLALGLFILPITKPDPLHSFLAIYKSVSVSIMCFKIFLLHNHRRLHLDLILSILSLLGNSRWSHLPRKVI